MRKPLDRASRFSARALEAWQAGPTDGLAVRAVAAGGLTEILLYDEIGPWGVTAGDFVAALAKAGGGDVRVRINSPGGDVFDGLAIYNSLLAHKGRVETAIDGVAASAATLVALAGAEVSAAESSLFMVHNAWGLVIGNRHDMRQLAGTLDKVDGQLAAVYANKTGKTAKEMAAVMDAETWFTAAEAKDAGFIDVVTEPPAKEKGQKAPAKAGASTGVQAPIPAVAASATLPAVEIDRMRRKIRLAVVED